MNIAQAYIGGVSSFFSIWVFCLLQVTPFLLAFIVGASLTLKSENPSSPQWKNILLIAAIPLIGFSLIFIPMGMTTTGVSRFIFRYLELTNQLGGIIIGLTNATKTANIGAVMLASYTFGVSTVIFVAGLALAAGFSRLSSVFAKDVIKKVCGVILLTVSFFILSGKMTDYKSFLVGRFVSQASTVIVPDEVPGGVIRR